MVVRDVERLEVVEVVLDLGTRVHVEARVAEDLDHAAQRARDRMQLPARSPRPGSVTSSASAASCRSSAFALERVAARVERRRERRLRRR